MGLLDSIFGGSDGVIATLSETLGGTATLKTVASRSFDSTTQTLAPQVVSQTVAFIPSRGVRLANGASTPESGRGLQQAKSTVSGTIPAAGLTAVPRVGGGDTFVYGGREYRIVAVEPLCVGDAVVQYALTGTLV